MMNVVDKITVQPDTDSIGQRGGRTAIGRHMPAIGHIRPLEYQLSCSVRPPPPAARIICQHALPPMWGGRLHIAARPFSFRYGTEWGSTGGQRPPALRRSYVDGGARRAPYI
jgi:hypothetical protein